MARLKSIRLVTHDPGRPVKERSVAGTRYTVTLYVMNKDFGDLVWNHHLFEGGYTVRAAVFDQETRKRVRAWSELSEEDRRKVVEWIKDECRERKHTILERPVKNKEGEEEEEQLIQIPEEQGASPDESPSSLEQAREAVRKILRLPAILSVRSRPEEI